jgi:hypothetical protein
MKGPMFFPLFGIVDFFGFFSSKEGGTNDLVVSSQRVELWGKWALYYVKNEPQRQWHNLFHFIEGNIACTQHHHNLSHKVCSKLNSRNLTIKA